MNPSCASWITIRLRKAVLSMWKIYNEIVFIFVIYLRHCFLVWWRMKIRHQPEESSTISSCIVSCFCRLFLRLITATCCSSIYGRLIIMHRTLLLSGNQISFERSTQQQKTERMALRLSPLWLIECLDDMAFNFYVLWEIRHIFSKYKRLYIRLLYMLHVHRSEYDFLILKFKIQSRVRRNICVLLYMLDRNCNMILSEPLQSGKVNLLP